MIGLQIPEIYWDDENAVSLLVEYFTRRRSSGDLFYSGAHFERLGGVATPSMSQTASTATTC